MNFSSWPLNYLALHILSGLTIALGVWSALSFFLRGRMRVLGRLEGADRIGGSKKSLAKKKRKQRPEEDSYPWPDSVLYVSYHVGKIALRRRPSGSLKKKLLKAGIPFKAEEFTGLVILCGVAAALFCLFLTGSLPTSALGLLLGFSIPLILLEIRSKKRMELFDRQLVEALEIMAQGLMAGFSFLQALSMVVKEMEPPVSSEFNQVLRETNLGHTVEEALTNMVERNGSTDLEMMVTALLIQRKVGGNLAEVLLNIATTIRERQRLKGEIKTLTAQGRLSALIICSLPPALMGIIYAINRDFIAVLFQEKVGLIMLLAALVLQLMGIMFIRNIIKIEV